MNYEIPFKDQVLRLTISAQGEQLVVEVLYQLRLILSRLQEDLTEGVHQPTFFRGSITNSKTCNWSSQASSLWGSCLPLCSFWFLRQYLAHFFVNTLELLAILGESNDLLMLFTDQLPWKKELVYGPIFIKLGQFELYLDCLRPYHLRRHDVLPRY